MVQLIDVDLVIPLIRKGDEARGLLTGISLTLSEWRATVVGASGSSKSSLLRLLNGMRQPTSNTVNIKGYDATGKPWRVRQLVGFIFTDPLTQLLMSTPIEDLTLSLGHLSRKERTGRAQQIFDERGLEHLTHQNIYGLSGGERQMVALVGVLAVRPEMIVADEPTTLLDLRNRLALRRALAELEQQVIYSTHDMDVMADVSRVITTEGGRATADGELGEVVT